jgi:hypothetical protein
MTGMKKRCCKCRKKKLLKLFARRRNGDRQSYCKPCGNAYHREHYARNKVAYLKKAKEHDAKVRHENQLKLVAYLEEHPCVDCGFSNILALDFDHVRGKKSHSISEMLAYSWKRIEAEIKKCEVRCRNCHQIRTSTVRGFYKVGMLGESGRPRHPVTVKITSSNLVHPATA